MQFGLVIVVPDLGASIHELVVGEEAWLLRWTHLSEPVGVELCIGARRAPHSDILDGAIDALRELLIISHIECPLFGHRLGFSEALSVGLRMQQALSDVLFLIDIDSYVLPFDILLVGVDAAYMLP